MESNERRKTAPPTAQFRNGLKEIRGDGYA